MNYPDLSDSDDGDVLSSPSASSSRLRVSEEEEEENNAIKSITVEDDYNGDGKSEPTNDSDKEFSVPFPKLRHHGSKLKSFSEDEEEEGEGEGEEGKEERDENEEEEEEDDDENEERKSGNGIKEVEEEEEESNEEENNKTKKSDSNLKKKGIVEEKVTVELRKNPQPLESLKSLKDRDILKKLWPLFSWDNTTNSLVALVVSNFIFLGTALCGFSLFSFVCYCSFFAILACGAFIYAPILYKKYVEGAQPPEGANPGDALEKYSEWLVVPVGIISEVTEFVGEAIVAFLEIIDAAVFFRTSLIFSGQVAFSLVLISILMSRFGFLVLLWVATDACFAGFPLYRENKKLVDDYTGQFYIEFLAIVDKGKKWIETH